jgi:hypothetical protein
MLYCSILYSLLKFSDKKGSSFNLVEMDTDPDPDLEGGQYPEKMMPIRPDSDPGNTVRKFLKH